MNRFLIPLALFIVVAGFLAAGLKLNPREIPSALIDKPAPNFTLPRLLEPEKEFSPKQMLGRVWLFNIWGTWCPSCRQEHPVLVDLAKRNIVPIIGLDYKDENAKAIQWLEQLGNPYEMTAVDADGRIAIDWGFYGAPETFVIDKLGNIRYKHIGPVSANDLETKILPLVKQLQEAS